jgi:ankyrin repeat protein
MLTGNGKWESQNKTFLESACWFNNNELVLFLLQKGAEIRYALHQCSNKEGFDLILQNGGDINQKDLSGNTVLHFKAQALCQVYDHMQQNIKYEWGKEDELAKQIEDDKGAVRLLIKKGSNPNIKNSYQFDVYDLARNLNEENKKEYTNFLNECLRGNDNSRKCWKFWK